MKKIAIFQANLNVGGIQRSLVNLIKSDILDAYEVDVYLFSKDVFYDISELSSNIHINFLEPFPYWFRFLPFGFIKKICKRPGIDKDYDIVIDYDSYRQECAYYVSLYENAKKIMWIHNDMSKEYEYNKKYRILYAFFKNKYKYFDEFVAVSEGVIAPFRKFSKMHDAKVTVIPNIINVDKIIAQSQEESEVKVDATMTNIACMGRIYVQKGYDYLLEDFQKAVSIKDTLRLYIIGAGPDEERYKEWVKQNNLQDKVYFLGNRTNPFHILKQMDAFCLESRYEGQGMVLWEAKVLGLKLIFPKRLEKYNIYLEGTDDIVQSMLELKKEEKKIDLLKEYQQYIEDNFKEILS
ncbi:MAG: glycosyltransferase [Agathobacter sp.]|nr:glycosyltransferase [Agathobacter sp.]